MCGKNRSSHSGNRRRRCIHGSPARRNISCDRNGSQTVWIAWSNLSSISLEGEGRGRCVRIVPAAGAAVELPVLSGQMQAAEAFLKRIDALEVRKPPT